jgi:hypothetical protein
VESLARISKLALDSAPLIYIATASVHKVDALLTNEPAWKRVKEVPIVVLEELT